MRAARGNDAGVLVFALLLALPLRAGAVLTDECEGSQPALLLPEKTAAALAEVGKLADKKSPRKKQPSGKQAPGKPQPRKPGAPPSQPKQPIAPVTITPRQLAVGPMSEDRYLIVLYAAPWCPACQFMKPHFNALGDGWKKSTVIRFVTVMTTDDDENFPVEAKIREIPTLVLYREGKEIARTGVAKLPRLPDAEYSRGIAEWVSTGMRGDVRKR